MPVLDIVTVPAKVLRTKADDIKKVDDRIKQLIDDMVETMREAPGVGLAAPQVGELARVVVVEWGDDEDEEAPKKLYAVINPQIVKKSNETVLGIEGCLSIPKFVGEVERAESITVKGMNRNGQPVKINATGWLARIFQHEIDHLDGILFTDRATALTMLQDNENPEEIEAQAIVTSKTQSKDSSTDS
jgi:peptide deformylase